MSRRAVSVRALAMVISAAVAVTTGAVLLYGSAGRSESAHAHHDHGEHSSGEGLRVADRGRGPVGASEVEEPEVEAFGGDPEAAGADAVGAESSPSGVPGDRPGSYGPAVPQPRSESRFAPDGSPAQGHDPANQPQPALAAVAAAPHGRSRDVSDASGEPREPTSAEVVDDVVLDGCHVDYGEPGECLPLDPPHAHHGGATVWTCRAVVEYFPEGLDVVGEDSLLLDGDNDGVACGPGDL